MIKKVKEMIKTVEEDGWFLVKRTGTSHRQFKHPTKKGRVTIAGKESKDLDHNLVKSILNQAGL